MVDEEFQPVRPYTQGGQPSAGYRDVDTSRSAESVRAASQQTILMFLAGAGPYGATSAEIADGTALNLGQTAGACSVLHKHTDLVLRLLEKRNNYRVYVLPMHLHGRGHD